MKLPLWSLVLVGGGAPQTVVARLLDSQGIMFGHASIGVDAAESVPLHTELDAAAGVPDDWRSRGVNMVLECPQDLSFAPWLTDKGADAGVSGSAEIDLPAGTYLFGEGGVSPFAAASATDAILAQIRGYVDGLEGSVDGLETLATALNGYVDGLETANSGDKVLYNGTAYTIQRAFKDAASSGDNEVVAAQVGAKIVVVSYALFGGGTVTAKFRRATTQIGMAIPLIAQSGIVRGNGKTSLLETGNAEALNLNLSGAVAVGCEVQYIVV